MAYILKPSPAPEVVIGLVAPIGVDLDVVTETLTELLREMSYKTASLRLTSLMIEVPTGLAISSDSYISSYKSRIAYTNAICERLGADALAAMAISAIRQTRISIWKNLSEQGGGDLPPDAKPEETPVPFQAYIVRQLKRPEEVRLFRSVYGRQFILVSAYSPQETRLKRIEEQERKSVGGLISAVDAHKAAFELIDQDTRESQEPSGQNVRDAFPLGDVFIDASTKVSCRETLRRFIHLLFGSNEITPTRDEYGMYLAKSASLRSSDLSRQVGAAVFRNSGEIATLGCNEVPKAGSGTYWPGDEGDRRDFVQGHDPNEGHKLSLMVDVLDRLVQGAHLSEALLALGDAQKICRELLKETGEKSIKESKLMDLLEFGRIIHAEMSAISDAARRGISLQDGVIYVTTFPCHLCAKHIVASGIKRLVYLEPYPKSYATDLHGDSIEVEGSGKSGKVSFDPFKGVSPQRYRDLFEKGKRKLSGGAALPWHEGQRHPMIEVYYPSYFEAEVYATAQLKAGMEELVASAFPPAHD
jgi:deoxycytidylate deaminase